MYIYTCTYYQPQIGQDSLDKLHEMEAKSTALQEEWCAPLGHTNVEAIKQPCRCRAKLGYRNVAVSNNVF